MESCGIGIAEGIGTHQKAQSDSNSDQYTLTCRQVLKSLIAILHEKLPNCNFKDSRFENSFLLDLDNNSSYLSCGTNKVSEPNNNSFENKHDKFLFSLSNDGKDSLSHIENRNAVICLLKTNELFCAISGDSQMLLIRFVDKTPGIVDLPSKGKLEEHNEIQTEILKEEIKKDQENVLEDIQTFSVKIQEKDLIILGCANLFTNITQTSILSTIHEYVNKQGFHELFPQAIAKEIANLANNANTLIIPASDENVKNEDVFFKKLIKIDINK